jgi:hypothetical protein
MKKVEKLPEDQPVANNVDVSEEFLRCLYCPFGNKE